MCVCVGVDAESAYSPNVCVCVVCRSVDAESAYSP